MSAGTGRGGIMMKKNWYGRLIGLCLVMCLAVGLCACGNNNTMVNAALAKENVYKLQEITLPEIDGDGYNVYASSHRDGMIYLMVEVYHWEDNSGNTDIRMISMKEDGTDIQTCALEFPARESGGSDAAGGNGGLARMAVDVAVPDIGVSDPMDTDSSNIWEYDNYYNYAFSPEGKVYAIHEHRYENYSDPENYVSTQNFGLVCWNADGTMQWEKELEVLNSQDEYVYVSNMTVAGDGTLYLILSGENISKMSVDAQGNISGKTEMSEDALKLFQNLDRLVAREDGTFLVMYYDENDWSKEFIATYDIATDTVGEPTPLPSSFSYNGFNTLDAGRNSDLIYSGRNGIYSYNVGDADGTMKVSFINSDLNISNMVSLIELDGNSFLSVFYENYGDELKAGILTYVNPEDIPDKAVLVLAGNYINNDMKKRVIEYNRTSDQYRIVIKDYDTYNSYEDYEAGYKQLNNDIITGGMPDILITDNLPVENYASKGLLADIGKLIEQDEELSQVEFVQSVLDAYSVDGKLYYVIPAFSVNTMVAKTSLVGERTSWTMAEAQQQLESMPEGTTLIGETTRDNFFNIMMNFCANDFIDVSTGKCDFNSQHFIDMMEYAKNLPLELSEDYYGEDYWMNYQSQYRDNRTILCQLNIYDIRGMNYTINGRIGEDVSYVGFPTENGMGSYVNALSSYAISSRSANLDGAWDFLRYYLTEEYQSSDEMWGLPIQMKYFRENAQKGLEKPSYVDEDGNKVEYDDTFYLNGESIILPTLTQAQIDKVVDFIFSVDKCYYSNNEVMKIINEEMESFYSGQKSAKDVAAVIQSRAQLYVDENR